MSTYDYEMIKLIAAKDNFDVAAEVYNLFPEIKERMIREFRESVKEKIIEIDTEKECDRLINVIQTLRENE